MSHNFLVVPPKEMILLLNESLAQELSNGAFNFNSACSTLQLHDASDSNEEKVRILRSLGSGKTEALTNRCLDLVFSVSCIRTEPLFQDTS